MGTGWELTKQLRDKILKYALYPQTSVLLRQMVQFGPNPSPGSIFLASQFIVEELPIRLAVKVKDLENAPLGLSNMPSTIKVRDWYAQSFEELTSLPKPEISKELQELLNSNKSNGNNFQFVKNIDNLDLNNENNIIEETQNPAIQHLSNPALHNIFSDDGMIVRLHSSSPSSGSFNSGLSSSDSLHASLTSNDTTTTHGSSPYGGIQGEVGLNSKLRSESPTFGKTYYTSCPANIIWPKEVYDYNKLVYDTLSTIKKRHDATVATMAQGVQEWKTENETVHVSSLIQTFLDKFYMSRIGIRMLIGQHIALNMAQVSPTRQKISNMLNGSNNGKSTAPGKSNYVGVICTDCNVGEIAEDAIESAKYICEEFYGLFEAPKIQLVAPSTDINFMYVPGHLIHMLFETLKNSLRATIEFHLPLLKKELMEKDPSLKESDIDINDLTFPEIKVIISEGSEDIAIKISDEGGGIPRSEVPLIWTYLYTTVHDTPKLEQGYSQNSFKAPMAGFGYGLPISRLYAQYFGGDLKLISMEGYGTDVYLHLNRLSSSSEPLP